MHGKYWAAMVLAAAMMPAAAMAQGSIPTQSETLTFTGIVDPNIANSVAIRQADGSGSTYIGTFPGNFPYQPNQPVTISMQANVPTPAYLQSAAVSAGNVPANGIYNFQVSSVAPSVTGETQITSGPTISGGLAYGTQNLNNDGASRSIISMQYNANTGQYSIVASQMNNLVGAGFTYDPATATLAACTGAALANNCAPTAGNNSAAFDLNGISNHYLLAGTPNTPQDNYTIASSGSWIENALGNIVGMFNLTFDGSWGITSNGSTGSTSTSTSTSSGSSSGGTAVPEPGMFGLFGLGAGWLVWRRRRARRTA